MVNKRFWLGTLVMTVIFGMAVLGCGDEEEEKKDYATTIEITGITGKTGLASVMIYPVFNATAEPLAGGQGTISNEKVIVTLKDENQKNWGGVGNNNEYHVFIVFGQDVANTYAFTSNRDWTGVGALDITDEASLFSKLPKCKLFTFNEYGDAANNFNFNHFRNIADIGN